MEHRNLKEPVVLDGVPDTKEDYICIIHGVGGWNSCIMSYDEDEGDYSPWATGFNNTSMGSGTLKGAIEEARNWARSDELALVGLAFV